jgi:outer membrane receptor protein involved in Fe transport
VRLRSLAIVAVLAAPVVASAHPPPSPPAPTPSTACGFAIDVHTIDADSHEALPFVAVYVDGLYVGETDEHGHVIAGGQCAGARQIKAERGDYLVGERTVEVSRSRSLELELTVIPAEVVEIEDEAPAPVALGAATTLRGAALDRTRGRGLSEALAAVPGVTQLRSGTAMAKPIVRGQFGRRLLLLVDGLRHRAQEWGLDHAPEIDPFTADAITVVRGAAGVAYGPDAIGGAVVVEPPPLRRTPGWGGDGFLVGTGNGAGGGRGRAPAVGARGGAGVVGAARGLGAADRRGLGSGLPDRQHRQPAVGGRRDDRLPARRRQLPRRLSPLRRRARRVLMPAPRVERGSAGALDPRSPARRRGLPGRLRDRATVAGGGPRHRHRPRRVAGGRRPPDRALRVPARPTTRVRRRALGGHRGAVRLPVVHPRLWR